MNSRNKGSRAELEVCRILTRWWTPISVATFRRTPLSGGWGNEAQFDTNGDIICSDETFPFSVEVKHREKWAIERVISGPSPVWSWWQQARDECNGKHPMLWFRKNRMPWFVGLPYWAMGVVGIPFTTMNLPTEKVAVYPALSVLSVPPQHFLGITV